MTTSVTKMQAPPSGPTPAHAKTVAIIVPASSRAELTPDEEISLRHLHRFLGQYDKFLLAPAGGGFRYEGLKTIEMSRKFFGSARNHGWMLFNPRFYRMFQDYQYVLIYHLDALVFRDDLLEWCGTGFDYIGSPWIPCADMPWVKEPAVGNGGFALMKVSSVLEVFRRRHRQDPLTYWQDHFPGAFETFRSMLGLPRRLVPRWLRRRATGTIRQQLKRIDRIEANVLNNDLFWSFYAIRYLPEFRIPDWRTGLRFSFEAPPRGCFELNDHRMPFGCHAWPRYDRSFWEPHLLRA